MYTLTRDHRTRSIQYVNAVCGGGKTRAAEDYVGVLAHPGPSGRKFILNQPNIDLIDQTAANIRRKHRDVRVTAIHSEACTGEGVVKAIDAHLKEARPGGEVLIITQQSFGRLGHFRNRADWHLIIDEIPQVHAAFSLRLARNNYQLYELIDAAPHDDRYSLVTPCAAPKLDLDEVATNKHEDAVWALFRDVVAKAQNPHWNVFSPTEKWALFKRSHLKDAEVTPFEGFALLDPSIHDGFASVTIMGANFRNSLLYQTWMKQGVEFVPHPRIKPDLSGHANGHLLSICYVSERQWSKEVRKLVRDGEKVLDRIVRAVEERMAGEKFIWMANNDIKESPFKAGIGADRLGNSPHGLNGYTGFDHAVILSALNPSPEHFGFLRHMAGIEPSAVRTSTYLETVYQTVSRTILRDPTNSARKTVVVMDQDAALWLASLYPGAAVAPLTAEPIIPPAAKRGRRKEYASPAERTAAYRARKRAEPRP